MSDTERMSLMLTPWGAGGYWNVGGAFCYDDALLTLYGWGADNMDKAFVLKHLHGCPACLWSIDWYQSTGIMLPQEIAVQIDAYEAKGIAITLYFDNPSVTQQECQDGIGNALLNEINARVRAGKKHAVAVASPTLAEYIRQFYPSIPQDAAVNYLVEVQARGKADVYKELAKVFRRVAVHPDDARNLPLLEQLQPRYKFEITVNDTCVVDCPRRRDHIRVLAQGRRSPYDMSYMAERHAMIEAVGCEDIALPGTGPHSLLLSHSDLQAIYALGFRHFRMQSQSLRQETTFAYHLMHTLLRKEVANSAQIALVINTFVSRMHLPTHPIKSGLTDFVRKRYD